ncbi:C25 family cysteine peptidase [Luteolibacter luteus]|uniref:Gingipain domain-containing protein n=1 Tax=Luteolibacter luteus TaxID=2728835 RepID=A0A858RHK9_9BACT|nr:C25 family cysteine peptidase [Luteolibacter luteus]QJE96666.1 hypothetical protein HHL09_13020 [Luteolibacter luteus]
MSWLRLALLSIVLPLSAAERGTWLCIGPDELLKEAAPLCEYRAAQGWEVVKSSAAPRKAIGAQTTKPAAILLLGDDLPGDAGEVWLTRAERHPYHGWLAKHPKEFVSDSSYGDLDHDGVPDVPVGRIPARTPEELGAVVKKILAWESRTPSPEDLTLPVWTGDPGFGKIGSVLKLAYLPFVMQQLRREAPPWAGFWFLQSDPRSPFCGWPADSAVNFNERVAQGGLLSAMIGHGREDSWWITTLPSGSLRYRAEDARAMTGPSPAPPHVVFACRCGAFADGAKRSLAEEFLFAPGGPVACVGASVDSHPLTNYYGSTSLLRSLGEPGCDTFGEAWVSSIRKAHERHEPIIETLVSVLEPLLIGKRNEIRNLKSDHLLIYNLLGDPATRLFVPQTLEAKVVRSREGWTWIVPKPKDLPTGARLIVQHRPEIRSFSFKKPARAATAADDLMRQVNDSLNFKTLSEMSREEEWHGALNEAGSLRLCLSDSSGIRVFAMLLGAEN